MPTKDMTMLATCNDGESTQQILEHFNNYILYLARKRFPRTLVSSEVWDLEIEELVQNVRIKLWKALQKGQIYNLATYISRIVQNESTNLARKYKRERIFPLPLDTEGELYEGKVLVTVPPEMQDPLDELESKEALVNCMVRVISHLQELPSRQRVGLICSLKDGTEDMLLLRNVCNQCGMDIEKVYWPEEEGELRRLRASLSIARKKLRLLMSEEVLYADHSCLHETIEKRM